MGQIVRQFFCPIQSASATPCSLNRPRQPLHPQTGAARSTPLHSERANETTKPSLHTRGGGFLFSVREVDLPYPTSDTSTNTEIRTFIGESSTAVGDGYAGLRLGRTCKLQIEHQGDSVTIVLAHREHVSLYAWPLVVSQEQFEKYIQKIISQYRIRI